MTKMLAEEMLLFLNTYGKHKLVYKYKGRVSDSEISHIIGSWATSTKSLEEILENFWKTYTKINKTRGSSLHPI